MSEISEKAQLEADLAYIDAILIAIDDAAEKRQQALHTKHKDYLSPSVVEARNTLSIRRVGIAAKLQRIKLIGR
ncbi:hypothetical protein PA10_00040 [Pseudomonas phage pPa_SNUABM_DT01]|nr:hypothetical protein PA10_00040 [Pseudomonas phage pPa_SNUABM_DT01]